MDKAGIRLGYQLGIRTNRRPYENQLATNQGDFQSLISSDPLSGGGFFAIASRLPREKRARLAGDAFNLNLYGETGDPQPLPAPYAGGAELRNTDISLGIPTPSF